MAFDAPRSWFSNQDVGAILSNSNDNRKPMSDLGRDIFEMMNHMNRVYLAGNQRIIERPIGKPLIIDPIKRPSQAYNPQNKE